MKTRTITMLSSVAIAMCATTASGAAPKLVPFHFTHGGFVSAVTPDGLWAVGVPRADGECNETQIVNLKTGELITLPVTKIIDKYGDEEEPNESIHYFTSTVTADGKIIGGSVDGEPAIWQDGVWTMVDFPNDNRKDPYVGYLAEISSIKAGGKYMTGMAYNDAYDILPLFWEDGELVELEGLPDRDWVGNKLGEGTCTMRYYNVSNDGNILLGGMSTNVAKDGCCFFVYDREKKSYDYIGTETLVKMMKEGKIGEESEVDGATAPMLSENGKYVAGNVLLVYEPQTEYGRDAIVPFIYNVETKEFKLLEGDQHEDILVSGITNDGHLLGSSPYSSVSRTVMFLSDNDQWYSLENILTQVYGLDFVDTTGYDSTSGTAFGISSDGKVLTAMVPGCINDGYNVTLDDETFFDATGKVNLLYNYDVIPANGSKIAILENFYVRFENGVVPTGQDLVEIVDNSGKTVAKSSSIQEYKNDNRICEIHFDQTNLKAGENYKVVVPAGTFVMESTGHKNIEITVAYQGRENRPMTVESISPRDGSAVNELGSSNMICLTFDGTAQTVTGKVGYLYQEGQESASTILQLVAYGNLVYVYPAASRKLMLGSNYKVVIPEGSIVDITGFCPNKELVINYKGAYEIPAPDIYSDYLFYEDFSNMSESLANVLRYEGDHREPVNEMVNWEFDADNQPWNFSVSDDDERSNIAAASHSMYLDKGKSDDWMATPQLRLGNGTEGYTLNFKAQSYRKDKQDYLKVLVWECDEILQQLDSEIVERMRTEGKVICNELLNPGESEEKLAGDWKDYKYDLDAYKGKNIYIAFVNENENQSVIFVDDINVVKRNNYRTGFIIPETVVGADDVEVMGFVEVTSDKTFNSLSAVLKDSKGKEIATYNGNDLGLTSDKGLYKFTFSKALPLVKGEINNYSMDVTLDQDKQSVAGKLSQLLFETTKRVVLEEMTGDWCGNCPLGIITIEHLENTIGENFIPVSIHNRDIYAWDEYNQFLDLSGAPTGKVNRIDNIVAPMKSSPAGYTFSTGDQDTFSDLVLSELEIPAVADIEIAKAIYDGDSNVDVEANVTFAMNRDNANYNIFTLLVEDNLPGVQTNYFAGSTDPLLADWGVERSKVKVNYADVARSMSGGSFYGENNDYIPSTVKAGEAYKANIQLPVPSAVKSIGSCKVICMLVDAGSGEIKNAYRLNEITVGDTAVDEITGDNAIVISESDGTIYVNGNSENVEVYNMQGARMANGNLSKGIYIVRASVDGKVKAAKILVR